MPFQYFPVLEVRSFGQDQFLIYSFFYAGIYIPQPCGRYHCRQNSEYKGTIIRGLIVMTVGYVLLSIPILATPANHTWLLALTCVALFLIAFGNGLFKGQSPGHRGPALRQSPLRAQRDSGFRDFSMCSSTSAVSWLLRGTSPPFVVARRERHDLQLRLPRDVPPVPQRNRHRRLRQHGEPHARGTTRLATPTPKPSPTSARYLEVFNTGIHYSFIASVAAMLISLVIFVDQGHAPQPHGTSEGRGADIYRRGAPRHG